ncbi:MAG TPA: hypothetical protein VG435_10645 [Acidimicrobiales bacterium]|jgi:hypothetical protein|nr:hypothetical protein [Acidimicrobiales bacterium]
MPSIYPAAPPTLSGDLLSISRFLQSPTMLRRRLRTYVDLRFVSDQILTNRYKSSGGAVLFEMSEPFLTARAVESVMPGQPYPESSIATGTGGLAEVTKWGQKVPLTDEEITRNVYGAQIVDRTLQKVVNSVIAQVDGVTMAAVASAVTATQAAGAVWDGSGSNPPTILRDVMKAKAKITNLLLGYNPDTVLMTDDVWTLFMSDEKVTNALRRETTDNPIYTGEIDKVGGLFIVHSPHAPANPLVCDAAQLGGMADEASEGPGYAVSDLAVQIKSIRVDSQPKLPKATSGHWLTCGNTL